MFFKKLALAAACILAATSVQAKEGDEARRVESDRVYLGATAGTLGIGPEIGYRFSRNFGVRANATFLSVSRSLDSDDITYDANLKLGSGGAMLDLYPFGGGFRISGGARYNTNQASGRGQPNSGTSFNIDGTTYTAAQIGTLSAETEVEKIAPALTIGYGGGLSKGLVFGIEAGVLFQGSVNIKPLTITGTCASGAAPAGCASILADLDAERRSLNDDIGKYKLYPILQISVGYRF